MGKQTNTDAETDEQISISVRSDGLGYTDRRGARPVRGSDAWPGVNRSALARRLGTSRSMVSRWLTGRVMPGLGHAGKLAGELGTTIEELQVRLVRLRRRNARKKGNTPHH